MERSNLIKVLVVSEFQLFRNALIFPFIDNNDFLVVGEADNYSNLLSECKKKKPDIVLLFFSSSIHDSLFISKKIKEYYSSIKTIIFSKNGSQESLFYSIKAGASALLSVDVNKDELIHAVKKINNGERYFTAQYYESVLKRLQNNINDTPTLPNLDKLNLTKREKEILILVSKGLTSKEISNLLNISKRTVDNFRASLMQKLNVKSLASLIRTAILSSTFLSLIITFLLIIYYFA